MPIMNMACSDYRNPVLATRMKRAIWIPVWGAKGAGLLSEPALCRARRSLGRLSDVLVAVHAVHRQAEVGEGGAVHVLLPGLLGHLVGQALELAGEDEVFAGVGDRRHLPLGGLAELLEGLGVLD